MKKSIKKFLFVPFVLVAILLTTAVGFYTLRQFIPPAQIRYSSSTRAFTIHDLREFVATKPYIFVGYIESTYDVNTTKLYRKHPDVVLDFAKDGYGFTECRTKIVKVIKGELNTFESLPFYVTAGVTPDLLMIDTAEGKIIPEKGRYYLLLAFAYEDGTLVAGDVEVVIPLEEDINEKNFEESKIYQRYLEAYNNQFISENVSGFYSNFSDYMSKYDKRYTAPGQLLPKEDLPDANNKNVSTTIPAN